MVHQTCLDCSRRHPLHEAICDCEHIFKEGGPERSGLLGVVERHPWRILLSAFLVGISLRAVGLASASVFDPGVRRCVRARRRSAHHRVCDKGPEASRKGIAR